MSVSMIRTLTLREAAKLLKCHPETLRQRLKSGSNAYYNGECDCGTDVVAQLNSLRSGTTHSCGCARSEMAKKRMTKLSPPGRGNPQYKHGHAGTNATITYTSHEAMVQRCTNPNNIDWENYGGRGIRICQNMRGFVGFYDVVGDRPAGMTLDRRNPNGHYSCGECKECVHEGWPSNVRWATAKQQANNRRAG